MKKLTQSLAIAIGINNYRNNIAELTTARPDAEELAKLLATGYNYQVELITDTTDRKPTLTELRTLLTEWLPQQLQPPAKNNRLLFYFAGHGMSLESDDGPRGFLLPQDANPNPKPGESNNFLPMQELHDALIALPCHHLLIILDCCFAGTFRWSSTRKLVPIPETIHRQHYDRFIRYPAWQVITSSAHNQEALDFLSDKRGISAKDEQHSPFAEALFEALQDSEPDQNGNRYKKADLTKDGVITAPELYLYLRDNVETRSGERQTPGLFPLRKHDRGEYIFHDPNFDPTTLSEAPELDEASNPYRGLKPFEEQHARFFFGRQELIEQLYARIAAPDHLLTVVLGISGSGKSSLVKAGLIPYLKQRSQPEKFAIDLAKACILTTTILYSFARLPCKPWFPPNFSPIDYTHQWQILPPMRPGESPFASLARILLAILDAPVSSQLNQLDFLTELLQRKHKQLKAETNQAVSQGKENSSRAKQLQREAETVTQLIADWNDASPTVRQRSLVEHFEMLYALCQVGEQESEQQRQLKQTFLDCLAPLNQQLQSDPGSLVAIAHTWAEKHPDTRLLLVIDQFEELITLGRTAQQDAQREQPEEWQQFLSLLETTLAANLPQLRIIVTLRSDFEPRFLSSEALKPYWSKARFPVRAMRSDELRQAIEGPASEMALYFEPANLVDRLTDEVGQMPGALPLLSFTLSELYVKLAEKWRNQEPSDRALTIDARFDQEGGVAGSLTHRANEEYQKIGEDPDLGEAGQRTMRRVMLRMLTLEGGETARRRVPDSELVYPTGEESDRVKKVVDRLVNARLLVRGQLETGEPYVEPAHDFLVRGWGILQDWINEEKAKETLELQQRLTVQANDWDRSNRPDGLLLPDSDRLKQLELFLQSGDNWFNQQEQDYVENSSKQAQKQRLKTTLPQEADRVSNLLQIRPVDGMILAIQCIGRNLDVMPEDILAPTQVALRQVIHIAKEENVILAHTQVVSSIAFNRQGTLIVSGSYDKTLRLWDKFGNPFGEPFYGHDFAVWSVDFHPDGEIIASGSHDSTIRLWDLQGNSVRQPFEGHQANVMCVNFSPDGTMIASCGDDQRIILWDLEGNIICDQFEGHKVAINCVTFHPNEELIASASNDGTVRLWNFRGDSIVTIQAHTKVVSPVFQFDGEAVKSVVFHPDGDRILSTGEDGTLKQWNLQGNPISEPFQSPKSNALSGKYTPDGRTIFSANGRSLYCWDLDGNFISQIRGHSDYIEAFAFNPDGRTIVTSSRDKTIRLWNLRELSNIEPVLSLEYPNQSVVFSSDGNSILVGCSRSIYQWNLQGELIKQFRRFSTGIRASANLAIAFKPRNNIFASYGSSNALYLQRLQGELIQELLQEHTGTITCIAFSPTQELLVSSSYDGTICLWHLEGRLITRFPKESLEPINSVAFSPNGEVIASGGDDSTVCLWDLQGKLIQNPFQGHEAAIMSVSFSSDGKIIASGSNDKTVRLWSLEGELLATLYGHTERINRIAFSPKDDLLASCSDDRTVRLWDSKGNLIGYPLQGHDQEVNAIAFSPDGKVIASIDNLTLRLWSVGWQPWLGICCDRLRYHPVFTNPESIEDPEQREIAIAACKTCEKYVWNTADKTD